MAFNSQYIKDEERRFLRDNILIRERWVRWFRKLINNKLPTTDPQIVEEDKQWPLCRPLGDVPFRYEIEETIRAVANRKAVAPDGFLAELLKVLADEEKEDTIGKVPQIHRRRVEGGGVPKQWKGATIRAFAQEERSDSV